MEGGQASGEELLQDFLSYLADYSPTLPDELVDYYAAAAGMQCSELSVRRLLAVAAQKFVAEVTNDAVQYCRLRQQGSGVGRPPAHRDRKLVFTHDDLAAALKEYGVELKRPDYFANSVSAGSLAPPPQLQMDPPPATTMTAKDD